MKRHRLFLPVLLLICAGPLPGQNSREIMQRAMRDELHRSMERLSLEKLKKPFFISYTIRDLRTASVSASLGALVYSTETRIRPVAVRVLVGDYSRSNENFLDFGYGFGRNTLLGESHALSLEDDYDAVRRTLWIETDDAYKSAAEKYERKIAAITQQKLSPEEAALADFCKAPATAFAAPPRRFTFDRAKWEAVVRALSGRFRNRPEIQVSSVNLQVLQGDVLFVNSEGTETAQPFSTAVITVNASTQAHDGDPLIDNVRHVGLTPDDFPDAKTIEGEIDVMADNLQALRGAPVMTDSYNGPVLIEGQAAGEFVAQRFFGGSQGLIAQRKPVFSDPRASMFMSRRQPGSLEEKIGTRILPNFISIRAQPGMKSCDGKTLVGSFEVDCDGVKPAADLFLVEKGILKSLIAGRIPTLKISGSNGHARPDITPFAAMNAVGPGVIVVEGAKGMAISDMKKELLRRAKEDGLAYGILVRSLAAPGSEGVGGLLIGASASRGRDEGEGSLTKPVRVYRVDVATGREELIRSAEIGGIGMSALRHIIATSRIRMVSNTLVQATDGIGSSSVIYSISGAPMRGIPATFIHPSGFLFEELEVRKEQRNYTANPPVVPHPFAR